MFTKNKRKVIEKGDIVNCEGSYKAYIVSEIDGNKAKLYYLNLSENGDDVILIQKVVSLHKIHHMNESLYNQIGFLNKYIRNLILKDADLYAFEE